MVAKSLVKEKIFLLRNTVSLKILSSKDTEPLREEKHLKLNNKTHEEKELIFKMKDCHFEYWLFFVNFFKFCNEYMQ